MPTQRTWLTLKEYSEILFEMFEGIAKITINRERYRNAFTPTTVSEISDALRECRERSDIRVVVLTGAGDKAFCSGGDMHVKGRGGYVGDDGVPRLNVLEVQKQIRSLPKPVIAMVNGYATSRLLRRMPASDRPGRAWGASTLASAHLIWRDASDRRGHARFGSFVGNTQPRRHWRWGW